MEGILPELCAHVLLMEERGNVALAGRVIPYRFRAFLIDLGGRRLA